MRSLRIALLSIAASSMLGLSVYAGVSGKAGSIDTAVATGNEIVLEVTSLYQVEVYRYSHNYGRYTNQFPVMQLKNPGNYFYMDQSLDSNGAEAAFNSGGHMIRSVSHTNSANHFAVSVTGSSEDFDIYFSKEDYDAGRKIYIPGIPKLKKIEILVGAGTNVDLSISESTTDRFVYNEKTRTYTLTEKTGGYLKDETEYFKLGDLDGDVAKIGRVFELDAIRLTYECE